MSATGFTDRRRLFVKFITIVFGVSILAESTRIFSGVAARGGCPVAPSLGRRTHEDYARRSPLRLAVDCDLCYNLNRPGTSESVRVQAAQTALFEEENHVPRGGR